MSGHDFFEGVRCFFFDKGNTPQWEFNSVSEIPDSEIDKYFSKLPDHLELNLSV